MSQVTASGSPRSCTTVDAGWRTSGHVYAHARTASAAVPPTTRLPIPGGQAHLADVRAALNETVGVAGLVERKRTRDDRLQASGAQLGQDQIHQRLQLPMLVPQVAEVQPEHALVAVDERQRIEPFHR